jgi:DNA polymerase-3 subunit gamma/tau
VVADPNGSSGQDTFHSLGRGKYMAHALYRKWRPQRWDEVAGQEHIIRPLKNAIKADRVAHAYLFAGPRGTGKTSTARLLAKAVNCLADSLEERPCGSCEHCIAIADGSFLDLIEIDAASNTSVDDVRDLRDRINFAPNKGHYKVYIVDEVHMLSTAAFNALLKTLEEPPPHAIFILATTEVHKIPATVLSRCQRHEFRRLPLATILEFLSGKVGQEGIAADPDALDLIARQATGSLRDAISLLDQLSSTGDRVTREYAEIILGTAPHEAVGGIIKAIAEDQVGGGLAVINDAIDRGADPRQLARQIVDYLRGLLLIQMNNADLLNRPTDDSQNMSEYANRLERTKILVGIKAFSKVASERRTTWQSTLPLELALIETAGQGGASNPTSNQEPSRSKSRASETKQASSPSTDPPVELARNSENPRMKSASPPAELAGTITFEHVLGNWRDVLQAARAQDPRVQALLNSCRPLGIENGALVIGFSSDLLREKMEKEHNIRVAIAALEHVFGDSLILRCVLTESWQSGDYESDVPSPMADQGMVATALRELGAQVVDVERLPQDSSSAETAN